MESDEVLDAKGLNCPLPILRAKKHLAQMESGKLLKIITTDPGSVKDFDAFCTQTGHKLEMTGHLNGDFEFYIRKV